MARRGGQSRVCREERRAESFGERQVHGVAGRDIVAKRLDSGEKNIVAVPGYVQVGEVGHRPLGSRRVKNARRVVPPKYLRDLQVQQMRRVERLVPRRYPPGDAAACRGSKQQLDDCRRIENDHLMSRSARNISAGRGRGTTGERFARRSSSCSRVGRSSERRSSAST